MRALLALVCLSACPEKESEFPARIPVVYLNVQCAGNNGLDSERVAAALSAAGIRFHLGPHTDEKFDVCEACYVCKSTYAYVVSVALADAAAATAIVGRLKREIQRPRKDTLWVVRVENEGRQCEDQLKQPLAALARPRAPGPELHILQRTSEDAPVCKACGCPQYSRRVALEIPREELPLARALGFEPRDAP